MAAGCGAARRGRPLELVGHDDVLCPKIQINRKQTPMFRKIEAWHYRSLQHISVGLGNMNILIGPNASGKSTFLDIFAFLQKALIRDVDEAIRERGRALHELVWKQEDIDQGFQLAIEVEIPENLHGKSPKLRYEVWIGLSADGSLGVRGENLCFWEGEYISEKIYFYPIKNGKIVVGDGKFGNLDSESGYQRTSIVIKSLDENGKSVDLYLSESDRDDDKSFAIRLPSIRLALSGLLEDPDQFPVALWFKQQLIERIVPLILDTEKLRRPISSYTTNRLASDGSNLPVIVAQLHDKNPERFEWWIGHLQTVLPDLDTVMVVEQHGNPTDHIAIQYKNGVQVPSWLLSDGTLRLLALTIIAYLPDTNYIYMIEEPENGLHPQALETVFQSLSSVYDGQVFVATHSPLFLNMAKPEQLIVFTKNEEGATEIVRGDKHPLLEEWEKSWNLGTLFASGVFE